MLFNNKQYSMASNMENCTTEPSLTCLLLNKNYTGGRANRCAMELIALILKAVKNNSTTYYALRKYTGTSDAQLKKYLELLTGIGFLVTDIADDKILYMISGTGLAFLRQYDVLRNMMLDAYYETNRLTPRQKNTIDLTYNRVLQPILQRQS